MSKNQIKQTIQVISVQFVRLQRDLADAGLYATMHKVNEASQKLGWEAAGLMRNKDA